MHRNYSQESLLLITVFLAFIGVSVGVPIFTPLLLNSTHSILPAIYDYKTRSLILGLLISLYPLGQFFGAPIIGRISDNYGRKPAMIYTLLGAGVGFLITAVSLHYMNIFFLMFSRLLTGIFEGNIAVARSSISDISTSAQKYRSFGKVAAAATLGTTAGPIIGGALSDHTVWAFFNFSTPFFCAAGLLFILVVVFKLFFVETFMLPETRSINLIAIKQYDVISRINKLGENSALKYFISIWLLIILTIDSFVFFLPAFLVSKWHMGPLKISIYVALLNIWYIFGSLLLVPYLAKYLKSTQAMMIGMALYSISLVLMLIPQNSYYLIPIFVLCDLASAVILVNGFVHISNLAKNVHQGEVMGIALGVRTLGGAIAGLIGGTLIAINTSAVIFLSILLSLCVVIFLYMYNRCYLVNDPPVCFLKWERPKDPL